VSPTCALEKKTALHSSIGKRRPANVSYSVYVNNKILSKIPPDGGSINKEFLIELLQDRTNLRTGLPLELR
jgi:hypothetical protein